MDATTRLGLRADSPVLLVVGDLQRWARETRPLPAGPGLRFVDFRNLDQGTVAKLRPDVVLSGLYGAGYDAMDVACLLQSIGFQGRYRVIADRIPKPGLVRTEVRHVAPNVDFDVINLRGELVDFV